MKKYYLHSNLLLGILFFGVIAVMMGVNLMDDPTSILYWFAFIASFGFVLLGIHTSWHQRLNKKPKPVKHEDMEVIFEADRITFPEEYYFKYGYLSANKVLTKNEISEININGFPPTLVINDNEVIFIPHRFKSELEEFAKRLELPIINRFDIWSALNEPFLDTEFDDAHHTLMLEKLTKNGLPEAEVLRIRKKIKLTMLSANSVAWEWVNLSQFDYLNWTWLTKKKYWWSMEIALRNYKKNAIVTPLVL